MKCKYFVYGLYVEGQNKPFYIGKSNTKEKNYRFQAHKNCAKYGHKTLVYKKIRKLMKNNINFYERRLTFFETSQEANETEKKLIKLLGKIKDKTGCLYNITDGGDGWDGVKHSEETKLKYFCKCGLMDDKSLSKFKELYENGNSLKTLAKIFGISTKAVYYRLKRANVKVRNPREATIVANKRLGRIKKEKVYSAKGLKVKEGQIISKNLSEFELEEIKNLYKDGKSISFISRKFNISWNLINKKIKLIKTKFIRKRKCFNSSELFLIKSDYESGFSLKELGEKYNCCRHAVRKNLINIGINIRSKNRTNKFSNKLGDEICLN